MGEVKHDGNTFLAAMDVTHIVWGWLRSVQYGLRRRRKGHKVTNQLRGVAAINFVPMNLSGFGTLQMLQKYGIPAWSGAVLGNYHEGEAVVGTALQMHVPASQVGFARYLLTRHGDILIDGPQPNVSAASAQTMPHAWADGPRPAHGAAAPPPATLGRVDRFFTPDTSPPARPPATGKLARLGRFFEAEPDPRRRK